MEGRRRTTSVDNLVASLKLIKERTPSYQEVSLDDLLYNFKDLVDLLIDYFEGAFEVNALVDYFDRGEED